MGWTFLDFMTIRISKTQVIWTEKQLSSAFEKYHFHGSFFFFFCKEEGFRVIKLLNMESHKFFLSISENLKVVILNDLSLIAKIAVIFRMAIPNLPETVMYIQNFINVVNMYVQILFLIDVCTIYSHV